MTVALWAAQILGALVFAFHGFSISVRLDATREIVTWMRDVNENLLRTIGALEILGAIGLILPAATGTLPQVTLVAAAGLLVLMILALGFHMSRGEYPNVLLNVVLGALMAFIAYGRLTTS